MRLEGRIKSWIDDRGYGFIEPSNGGPEIFVHIKSFSSRYGRPRISQIVSFEIEFNHEGKKRAKNVEATFSPAPVARERAETHAKMAANGVVPGLYHSLFC
jgi:cold shock CspA family protein